jgi:multidrug transporter EmrE-like cation transporter
MIWAFLLGFIGLCAQTYVSYDESLQDRWFYYPLGILLNSFGAVLWFYVAKITSGKETFIAGAVWDAMAALAFFGLPLLFFGVKLTMLNALGLALGAIGITLMKVGG